MVYALPTHQCAGLTHGFVRAFASGAGFPLGAWKTLVQEEVSRLHAASSTPTSPNQGNRASFSLSALHDLQNPPPCSSPLCFCLFCDTVTVHHSWHFAAPGRRGRPTPKSLQAAFTRSSSHQPATPTGDAGDSSPSGNGSQDNNVQTRVRYPLVPVAAGMKGRTGDRCGMKLRGKNGRESPSLLSMTLPCVECGCACVPSCFVKCPNFHWSRAYLILELVSLNLEAGCTTGHWQIHPSAWQQRRRQRRDNAKVTRLVETDHLD